MPSLARNETVMLLQGPIGPFFHLLAERLKERGCRVLKVNFNQGDELFYPAAEAFAYEGTAEQWPDYLEALLRGYGVRKLYLFGDCRPLHRAAIEVAKRCSVVPMVFEEGYVRPRYITLEPYGVNGHSLLPRSAAFYRALPACIAERVNAEPVNVSWRRLIDWAIGYALRLSANTGRYSHYRHHRELCPIREAVGWSRSLLRKVAAKGTDRLRLRRLRGRKGAGYFVVPLQVAHDAQVLVHSRFSGVPQFIEEVLNSFAAHADTQHMLVFKHHPMDRGHCCYAAQIRGLARRLGVERRVLYVREAALPRLLKKARGTVVINSTVGLSALGHGSPVKVLGTGAPYDIEGLADQQPLDGFWQSPAAPDAELLGKFRGFLIRTTQVNGSFYSGFPRFSDETRQPAPLHAGDSQRTP